MHHKKRKKLACEKFVVQNEGEQRKEQVEHIVLVLRIRRIAINAFKIIITRKRAEKVFVEVFIVVQNRNNKKT